MTAARRPSCPRCSTALPVGDVSTITDTPTGLVLTDRTATGPTRSSSCSCGWTYTLEPVDAGEVLGLALVELADRLDRLAERFDRREELVG